MVDPEINRANVEALRDALTLAKKASDWNSARKAVLVHAISFDPETQHDIIVLLFQFEANDMVKAQKKEVDLRDFLDNAETRVNNALQQLDEYESLTTRLKDIAQYTKATGILEEVKQIAREYPTIAEFFDE